MENENLNQEGSQEVLPEAIVEGAANTDTQPVRHEGMDAGSYGGEKKEDMPVSENPVTIKPGESEQTIVKLPTSDEEIAARENERNIVAVKDEDIVQNPVDAKDMEPEVKTAQVYEPLPNYPLLPTANVSYEDRNFTRVGPDGRKLNTGR